MQAGGRKTGKHVLEIAKGSCGLKGLLRRSHRIVGGCSLDEVVCAPKIPSSVLEPGFTLAGRNQGKHTTIAIRLAVQLVSQMGRHPLDIVHHGDRILEDVVVHALDDIAYASAIFMEDSAIGIVDVAAAVGRRAAKLAIDGEMARDGADSVVKPRVLLDSSLPLPGGECSQPHGGDLRDRSHRTNNRCPAGPSRALPHRQLID